MSEQSETGVKLMPSPGPAEATRRELSAKAEELRRMVERSAPNENPAQALLHAMRNRRAERSQTTSSIHGKQPSAGPEAHALSASKHKKPAHTPPKRECSGGANANVSAPSSWPSVASTNKGSPPWIGPLAVVAAAVAGLLGLRARRRARLAEEASAVAVHAPTLREDARAGDEWNDVEEVQPDDVEDELPSDAVDEAEAELDLSRLTNESAMEDSFHSEQNARAECRPDTAFKPSLGREASQLARAQEHSPPSSPSKEKRVYSQNNHTSLEPSADSVIGGAVPYVELRITVSKLELDKGVKVNSNTLIRSRIDLRLRGEGTSYARQKVYTDWDTASSTNGPRGCFAFILPQSANAGELQVRIGAEGVKHSIANFGIYVKQVCRYCVVLACFLPFVRAYDALFGECVVPVECAGDRECAI